MERNQAVANSRSDVTPRRKRMSAAMKSARKRISPPAMESARLKKERNALHEKILNLNACLNNILICTIFYLHACLNFLVTYMFPQQFLYSYLFVQQYSFWQLNTCLHVCLNRSFICKLVFSG